MLKVVLSLVLALVLTNGLPVRNRFNEDFDDYAREMVPRERSNFAEDLYDEYLRRREPNEGTQVLPEHLRSTFVSNPSIFCACSLYAVVYIVFTGRLEDYLLPQTKRVYDELYYRETPGK